MPERGGRRAKFCAQAWWFSHMPGSKCAFRRGETVIFASAPRTWRVAAPLASSGRFLPFSKTLKTLGPFAQKVLRPPAGAPGHGMCVFTHACQQKLASGLKNPGLFRGPGKLFQGLPRGLRNGSPGPGPPRRLQEPSATANVRFLL